MRELHIEVPRSARYFVQGESVSADGEVWYVCHGYRQLANRFLRRFEPLDEPGRTVVAPEGLSRFYLEGDGREHTGEDRVGATWMTREDRLTEIGDYVRYLDLLRAHIEGDGPARRRVVLGFSQGVHTVSRWVALGAVEPHLLVLWGAYLPGDLPDGAIDRLNRSDVLIVRGRTDPFVNDAKHAGQLERLREMGLRFDVLEHPDGHRIEAGALKEIAARVAAAD